MIIVLLYTICVSPPLPPSPLLTDAPDFNNRDILNLDSELGILLTPKPKA